MNRLFVDVVICLAIFGSISATEQHLICKSVNDVFSSDVQVHSTRILQGPSQGRPGKIGPRGIKGDIGEKGERGSEGIVDYTSVDDRLEGMVTSANAKLQAKVERLEQEILDMTILFSKLLNCTDGFLFGSKCYFATLQAINSRSHGKQICAENGAKLAEILNVNHETLVLNYMRVRMNGLPWFEVWTAAKYEASTATVRLSDGNAVPASTLRWYTGYPSASHTGVILQTRPDATHSRQGFYNYLDTQSTQGVLCEK